MTSQHQPGTYVKGDRSRYAETKADAVAAIFDGFVLVEATEAEPAEVDENPPVEVVSDLGKGDSVSADADPGASGGAAGLFA